MPPKTKKSAPPKQPLAALGEVEPSLPSWQGHCLPRGERADASSGGALLSQSEDRAARVVRIL
eukprot:scaffold4188_cov115-Isochrysis_galbana.AAC.1